MRLLSLTIVLVTFSACDTGLADVDIGRYRGERLTEADAMVPNGPLGSAGWDGLVATTRAGRSVLLERRTRCSDECSQTVRLQFEGGDVGGLPQSATGVMEQRASLPDRFESTPFEIDRVEIQDWGPEVYSGVVYTAASQAPTVDAMPLVFWADHLPQASE